MSGAAPDALFYALLLGAGTGLLFTVLEAVRILLSFGKILTFLSDVLFGLVTAAATFILALAVSGGSLRLYQLGCEAIGFASVALTVTHAVRRFLPAGMRFLRVTAEKARLHTDAVVKKICGENRKESRKRSKKCGFLGFRSKKNEKKT